MRGPAGDGDMHVLEISKRKYKGANLFFGVGRCVVCADGVGAMVLHGK